MAGSGFSIDGNRCLYASLPAPKPAGLSRADSKASPFTARSIGKLAAQALCGLTANKDGRHGMVLSASRLVCIPSAGRGEPSRVGADRQGRPVWVHGQSGQKTRVCGSPTRRIGETLPCRRAQAKTVRAQARIARDPHRACTIPSELGCIRFLFVLS